MNDSQGMETRGSAPRSGEADLEEIPVAQRRVDPWALVRCGILVEQRVLGGERVEHWQEAVRSGEFDPEACARDLLADAPPEARTAEVAERVRLRSATLLRDLVMAPVMRGRSGRTRSKTAMAILLSQFYLLLVWGGLLLVLVLVLRLRGVEFDPLLDGLFGSSDGGVEAPPLGPSEG